MAIYGNMVVPSKAAGGALPTDNSDRNVYVPGSEVSGRLSDAGGVLAGQAAQQAAVAAGKSAEGLGNLGKGIGALGSMGLAFYTRQRRIEHAEAMEAVARLQTEYGEKQREWSQIKGANAIGMEELKSRWWDEAIPRLTQNLSDYGKRYFNLNADRVGAQADTYIQNHQEQQINQYESTQLKVAMDSEANMINLDPYNQQQTSASIGRIQALIHQDCLRKGLPPEVEQQMVRQAVGTAFGNAIAMQIQQGRLDGAQQLFTQYQQIIPADQQAKLLDAYDSNARQLGAAQAANGDMRGLESTMRGGSGVGGTGPARGQVSKGRISGTEMPDFGPALSGSVPMLSQGVAGMVYREAVRQGVDPVLMMGVAAQESGGKMLKRNSAGCWGIMQVHEKYAHEFGQGDFRNDPEANIRIGITEYKQLLKHYQGNRRLALMAYNWGIGNIDHWLKTGRGLPTKKHPEGAPMPAETREYVWRVLGRINPGQTAVPAGAPAQGGQQPQAGQSPQGGVPPQQAQSGGIQGLGMKPETLLHFQSVLAPQAMANSWWKELETLPADKLDYEYDKRMQALQKENPVMASKVDSLVRPMVARQKEIYKAESEQRVGDWGVKVKGLDPLAVRDTLNKAVAAGQITEEEAAKVYDRTVGSKRTPSTENREAVVEIKRLIDRGARGEKGGITERGQVESAAINGRLTDAQTNDCLEYLDKGGQRSIVDVTRIEKVWKQYREDQGESVSSKDKIPPELVDFVYADMTPGKIPSTQELRNSIAKGYIRGKALFGKNYAYEAAAKGDKDWFDARMTDDDWKNVTKWIETNWPDVKKPYTFALMKEASRQMQGMPWGVKNEKQGGVR